MLLQLFRMIVYGLAIFFIYRLVVRIIQYLRHGSRSEASQKPQESSQKGERELPRDIREAQFRDLPDNSQKPS